MKKVFSIITTILATLLFISGTIVSIIDLVSPDDSVISTYMADKSYNFLLLIFCAVGLVIIFDNILDGSQRKDIKAILTSVNREKIDVKIFPTQVEFYDYFEDRIKKLSSNSSIYVTTFDKYNANYDHTEGKELDSDTFMDCWEKYVVKKNILVKQLVHITDKHDVEQLISRIENNKKSNNFIISVMVGLPLVPYIDWIVIDGRYTLITIPSETSNPYDGEFGFAIDNRELAQAFITYFELYNNSKLSKVVLGKNGTVETSHLNDVTESVMQARPDLEEMNEINKYLFNVLSNNNIRYYMNDVSTMLHKISICDKTGILLDLAIKSLRDCSIQDQSEISVEESLSALLKIYGSEGVNIKAVSCSDVLPSFWSDDVGKAIQRLCKDSSKNNRIERVYIYNGDDDVTEKMIKDQKSVASYKIDKKKFPVVAAEAEDFILVDDKMLLILKNESASISLNQDIIKKYSEKFKSLVGYSK